MKSLRTVLAAGTLATSSCGGCSDRPEPVSDAEAQAIVLSVDVPFAELQIPPDNRPEGTEPPDRIALDPAWRLATAQRGTTVFWETALPIRLRTLFFSSPPPGMKLLLGEDREIPHVRDVPPGTIAYSYDAKTLQIRLPMGESDFPFGDLRLVYPMATQREKALNHRFSGIEDPAEFVRSTIQAKAEARSGLLLPAPGVAAWDITVPPAAELYFAPGLVRPEIRDDRLSDGASLSVEVEVEGTVTTLWTGELEYDRFPDLRLDLGAWSGRSVRLRFRTDPGETSRFDYAFVTDPVVASRKAHPRRVVLLFVDTLRRDHVGVYGYERDTTPALDAFAKDAVVFEDTRSVAPWTLPSARTILTGRHPEHYADSETIQKRFRAAGYTTAMFAGNLYLSSNFGLHRDWALHHIVNWPDADEQVEKALEWLDAQEGRDQFLVVHFMDPHLPYTDPPAYHTMWAGPRPETIPARFQRGDVVRAGPVLGEEGRRYVVDRYDGTVRFADDQIARLFARFGPDDIVVFLSDHGEEFWDHRGFEHGHTVYDELLRVPLVIRAPGLSPGRVAEPTSLLDLVPTVLDLAGLGAGPGGDDAFDGVSLVPAIRGDAAAKAALGERSLGFGRPLYGESRWGAVRRNEKYSTVEGRESLFDLSADPEEKDDLLFHAPEERTLPYRAMLAEGLDTEVAVAYRITAGWPSSTPEDDCVVEMNVPGGIAHAWVGDDSTSKSSAAVEVTGEVARITWHKGFRGSREVFVVPVLPVEQVTHALDIQVTQGGEHSAMTIAESRPARPAEERQPLTRLAFAGRTLELTWGIAPLPHPDATPLESYDAELASMLRAMGYAVGDEGED